MPAAGILRRTACIHLASRVLLTHQPTDRPPTPPAQAFITSPEVLAATFPDLMQILDKEAGTVMKAPADDLVAAACMTNPSRGIGTVDARQVLVTFDRAADEPAGPAQE